MTGCNTRPSILIVLIAGIGDMVLASKSIRAIRNGFPHAEIHLLASTEAAPLAIHYPYIDHVHAIPIRELRHNKRYFFDILKIIHDLNRTRFDLVLNLYRVSSLSGSVKMGLLFGMLTATKKIGHGKYGFGLFLTDAVPVGTFEGGHVVDAMLKIATRAGGVPDERGIEVFWNTEITSKWEAFFTRQTGKIIVGINPGGDRENRRWAPDRFASIAEKMIERFDAGIVLLGGPAEKNITAYIGSRISSDVSDLAGKTSVDELPYITSRLDLLITNDSGPMHIAAATRTPLVALFGPEDPSLFGPYTEPELYRIIYKDVSCSPGGEAKCTPLSRLELITSDDVLEACCELLHGKLSEK